MLDDISDGADLKKYLAYLNCLDLKREFLSIYKKNYPNEKTFQMYPKEKIKEENPRSKSLNEKKTYRNNKKFKSFLYNDKKEENTKLEDLSNEDSKSKSSIDKNSLKSLVSKSTTYIYNNYIAFEEWLEWKSDLTKVKENINTFSDELKEVKINLKSQNQRFSDELKEANSNLKAQNDRFDKIENQIKSLSMIISEFMKNNPKNNKDNKDKKDN